MINLIEKMNTRLFRIYICAVAAAALAACGSAGHDHENEHDHEHAHSHEHGHEHGHGEAAEHAFGSEIVVEPEVAERFGVKCDTVQPGTFRNVVRASGTAMPSAGEAAVVAAPMAGIVRMASGMELGRNVSAGATIAVIDASGVAGGNQNAAAGAALNAAKAEYERIDALFKERLATVGELNAARAAYEQAKAAYSPRAASGAATSPIAGTVTAIMVPSGSFVNVGDPIASVASDRNITLRVDLPQKYFSQVRAFTDAVVELPYGSASFAVSSKGGKRVAGASMPAAAGSSAYIPVYFTMPNDGSVLPSSAFTVYLLGDERSDVITLPVSALSEQQGQFFVYEKIDDEGYMKRPVTVGQRDGLRAEIIAGIEPGQVIVTEGTTTIRLAESGSAIPEGHTHNH